MCIEFLLALLYLLTILIITFFLFQWIKKDLKKNVFFSRVKFIEVFFTTEQFLSFFYFFQFFQKETLPEVFSFPGTDFLAQKDLLLLGVCYQRFQKKAQTNSSSYYYWKLLEMQYLCFL